MNHQNATTVLWLAMIYEFVTVLPKTPRLCWSRSSYVNSTNGSKNPVLPSIDRTRGTLSNFTRDAVETEILFSVLFCASSIVVVVPLRNRATLDLPKLWTAGKRRIYTHCIIRLQRTTRFKREPVERSRGLATVSQYRFLSFTTKTPWVKRLRYLYKTAVRTMKISKAHP
jgi:hypothetical protein